MKKTFLICVLFCLVCVSGFAQRVTDKLDRGLIAMKVDGGVFLSWRLGGEEYYDTKFNIYRDAIKSLHDKNLVSDAYGVASQIDDETKKAESLMELMQAIDGDK